MFITCINTSSFDIPTNNVTQNAAYNNAPTVASTYTAVAPTPAQCQSNNAPSGTFYSCPTGLGVVKAHHREPPPDSDVSEPDLLRFLATLTRQPSHRLLFFGWEPSIDGAETIRQA